jgi:ribose 1,5-bisphosphokinase
MASVTRPIGPGAFIAVCGPSGGGKDSLLRRARELSQGARDVVFPRRTVTRPSSEAEDHDSVGLEVFDDMLTSGLFAMSWDAHGLKYGLPGSIDGDIAAARVVIANVSRAVLPELRRRYVRVVTVLVTAPPEMLMARIASRARATDGSAGDRIARSSAFAGDIAADTVIENTGSIDEGARRLLHMIETQRVVVGR